MSISPNTFSSDSSDSFDSVDSLDSSELSQSEYAESDVEEVEPEEESEEEESEEEESDEQDLFMVELRKLLGIQYHVLSRAFHRSGRIPQQTLSGDSPEVDQLLAQCFSSELGDDERAVAVYSLEAFYIAAKELAQESDDDEFPRFDNVWERYEAMVLQEFSGDSSGEYDEDLAG